MLYLAVMNRMLRAGVLASPPVGGAPALVWVASAVTLVGFAVVAPTWSARAARAEAARPRSAVR